MVALVEDGGPRDSAARKRPGARVARLVHVVFAVVGEAGVLAQHGRAANTMQAADAEIARFRAILQQIDELENEFEKIKRIREIVRSFKGRVEEMERRLG